MRLVAGSLHGHVEPACARVEMAVELLQGPGLRGRNRDGGEVRGVRVG